MYIYYICTYEYICIHNSQPESYSLLSIYINKLQYVYVFYIYVYIQAIYVYIYVFKYMHILIILNLNLIIWCMYVHI